MITGELKIIGDLGDFLLLPSHRYTVELPVHRNFMLMPLPCSVSLVLTLDAFRPTSSGTEPCVGSFESESLYNWRTFFQSVRLGVESLLGFMTRC